MPATNKCAICDVNHGPRDKENMREYRAAVQRIFAERGPMTIRAMFYQLVKTPTQLWKDHLETWRDIEDPPPFYGRQTIICKTEYEADNVSRVLGEMRENFWDVDVPDEEKLDWSLVLDFSRTVNMPSYNSSLRDTLTSSVAMYHASYWKHIPKQIWLWCEKSTLNGLIQPVASKWQVPFIPTTGFSSKTVIHDVAEKMKGIGKPVVVFDLGDYDPSGERINESLEATLRRYLSQIAPDLTMSFEKLAVLPHQIEKWKLPTRPTKAGKTNTHAGKADSPRRKRWTDESSPLSRSVEVDAVDPDVLEKMLMGRISEFVSDAVMLEASIENIAAIQAVEYGLMGLNNSIAVDEKRVLLDQQDWAENLKEQFGEAEALRMTQEWEETVRAGAWAGFPERKEDEDFS